MTKPVDPLSAPDAPNPDGASTQTRDRDAPIESEEIIKGLAGIAMDETAPVTARVSAYSLLGKHLGLFAGIGGEAHSDLAALMREIADRNKDRAGALPGPRKQEEKDADAR